VGGEVVSRADDSRQMWRLGHGVVTFEQRARFARASASGGALDHMRDRDSFYGYLSTLAEQPHAVTRLDACFDTESPGHVVVADLWRRYPRSCSLRRKAIATKRIVSTDADGHETGTFYVGHRSAARVTARVYDKRQPRANSRPLNSIRPIVSRITIHWPPILRCRHRCCAG